MPSTHRESSTRAVRIAFVVLLVALAGCSAALPGGNSAGGSDGGSGAPANSAADGGSYYVGGERVVIREADMRIEVGEFDQSFDETRAIARAHGGFVADWNVETERGWQRAQLVVRVPAENFGDARDDLSDLGTVENEDVRAKDFTDTDQDIEARLADLRRDERELERLLNGTDDAEDARRIRSDLSDVRNQIRELESRQTDIERREALSTIRVTLHEPPGERPPKNYRSAFGFDDAFLDAFYGGLAVVKYVIVLFGYAIPVSIAGLLLAGFGFVSYRAWLLLRARLAALLPDAEMETGD